MPFSAIGAVWYLYIHGYNKSIAVWVGLIALLMDNLRMRLKANVTPDDVKNTTIDLDALIELVGDQMRSTFEADIVYVALSDRGRLWIDIMGTLLFLLPACVLMTWLSSARTTPRIALTSRDDQPVLVKIVRSVFLVAWVREGGWK